jgi:hypothetical protein
MSIENKNEFLEALNEFRSPSSQDIEKLNEFGLNPKFGEINFKVKELIGYFLEAMHNPSPERDEEGNVKDLTYSDPAIDTVEFKGEVIIMAGEYLYHEWMHFKLFTDIILVSCLDSELYPLKREIDNPSQSQVGKGLTELPSKKPKGWLYSLFSWGITFFTIYAIYSHWVWASILGVIGLWLFMDNLRFVSESWLKREFFDLSMPVCYRRLKLIRDEIKDGNYNPIYIAARLKDCEQAGIAIPNIAFKVLDC